MKLTRLRISNFQSFRQQPTVIGFEATTFLLGPNCIFRCCLSTRSSLC